MGALGRRLGLWPLGVCVAALSSGAVLTSCAVLTKQAPRLTPVSHLELRFPSSERGQLTFEVQVPPGSLPVRAIVWELVLDGVPFASGIEAITPMAGATSVTATVGLVSRHLGRTEGSAQLELRLRGQLDVGPGDGLHFVHTERVSVEAAPRPTR